MVLPALGAIAGAAGTIAPLLLRQFHSSRGAGTTAGQVMAGRAARQNLSMARSQPGNASLQMRNALLANSQMQGQVAGQAAAIEAQQAQTNAGRRTAYDNQTGALVGAGLGAIGAGLSAFGGGGAAEAAGGAVGALAGGGSAAPQQAPMMATPPTQPRIQGLAPTRPMNNDQFGTFRAAPPAGMQPQLMGRAMAGSPAPYSFTPQQPFFTSDERVKREIRSATGMEMDQFLSALRARQFRYDPGAGPQDGGPRTGVMAQQLERTRVGEDMVTRAPDGTRVVDSDRALQANLAASGRLDERLRSVEAQNQLLMRQLQRAQNPTARAQDQLRNQGRTSFPLPPSRTSSEMVPPAIEQEFNTLPQNIRAAIRSGRLTEEEFLGLERAAPNLASKFRQQLLGRAPSRLTQ